MQTGIIHMLESSIVALLLLLASEAFAQTKIIGKVTDSASDKPLIGVNITVKGKQIGTITDAYGNYELNAAILPPFTVVFSYTGYATKAQVLGVGQTTINVRMIAQHMITSEVTAAGSRMEARILEAPGTVEKMDAIAIGQTATPDFYEGISNLKGVQATMGSLTFTSINARGFGMVANERFVQLIDGMDSSAPFLNFPTGNMVGISELDAQSIELVAGSASPLYGPNAFNGLLLMHSKNPFTYQGLSVQTKVGVTSSNAGGANPYSLISARYAYAFRRYAVKINASYLQATDWLATDYESGRVTASQRNPSGPDTPNFDGLNTYGDETEFVVPMATVAGSLSQVLAPLFAPQLGISVAQAQALLEQTIPRLPTLDLRRSGFREQDLLESNDAKSIKLDGAFHYRIGHNLEASYCYRYGSGSTSYQGGDRYALRDFSQQFHKIELSNAHFWLRGYTSATDDGNSYNLSALGTLANERFKPSSGEWIPTYAGTYAGALLPIYLQGGTANATQLASAHTAARNAANQGIPAAGSKEFQDVVNAVRNDFLQRNPPGAGFFDNSRMYHAETGFNFKELISPETIELLLGANFRQYDLFSDGTIFNEDPEGDGTFERIKINEYGGFIQASKRLFNKHLRLLGSLRYDKNENFEGQVSPRLAVVYTAGSTRQHNLRTSYQTGFRNPSTQHQFIFLPTGQGKLIGSTAANAARYGIHNGGAYTNASYNAFIGSVLAGAPNPELLEERSIAYVQPEQLRALEFGYKGLVTPKFFVDFNVYYSIYNNFITEETVWAKTAAVHRGQTLPGVQQLLGGEASSATAWRPYVNVEQEIRSFGLGLALAYQFPKGYSLLGNYTYSTYRKEDLPPNFEVGFNMPEHKVLMGFGNRKAFKNFGFDLNYRWQDKFFWENSFAYGTIPAFGVMNVQASYTMSKLKTVLKLGGTNTLGRDYRTNAGGPLVGQVYYLSLTYDDLLK